MFDIENLMHIGVFNQLIPIWQVFFFIASLLPFLLWNRVKVCLLITYMFTFYLGLWFNGETISPPPVRCSPSSSILSVVWQSRFFSSRRSSASNLKKPKFVGSVTRNKRMMQRGRCGCSMQTR